MPDSPTGLDGSSTPGSVDDAVDPADPPRRPPRVLGATGDREDLRRTFSSFPSGVVAVAALVDGAPAGMAAGSFVWVSMDPPLISVSIDNASRTWPQLRRAPRIGVSVLGEGHDVACRQLSSRTRDRFAGLDLERTLEGALLVHGATTWFDCTLHQELPAGDHTMVLLRVQAHHADPDLAPLVYQASGFHRLVAR